MKYQVAEYEIDTAQFQLSSGNTHIAVEPKVFDLLVYLIENRKRLVTREELFKKIWAGREVSDTTLSNHIKSARKALGDNGDLQKCIKTIRGRGYQFVADVSETSVGYYPTPPLTDKTNRHLPIAKLIVFFISLLALTLLAWQAINPSPEKTKIDARPYVLVVPFSVSGGDSKKWQPFADQMTREVILKLRQISGLRVIPASSAFMFTLNKTPEFVRDKLPDVNYLLDATIKVESGVTVQISAVLEDLVNQNLVWNERYQSRIDSTNFFSIQTDIAQSVSDSLEVVILAKEQGVLASLPTSNLAAYELYVEGQKQLNLLTHDALKRAIALFSEAIVLDPQFEAAYVAKADAYRIIMTYFEKPAEILPQVIDSVSAALAINPSSAKALSSLGLAYAFAWRWQDAWKILNAARSIDTNIAQTELGFALYYSAIGDIEGVRNSLHSARKIDPLNIELADWGHWALAMVGENDAAMKWAKKQIQLHPEVGLIYSGASVSASLAGQHERAISLAQKGLALDSGSPYAMLALAQTYGHAQRFEKVPPLLVKAQQAKRYLCPYETAVTYLLIDQPDKAFELFNDAVTYRSNCLVFTRNDPRLKNIRNDPRYLALLTRIGLGDDTVGRYPR